MSKEKKPNLTESSRLSGNVLEYYMKYGRERELEKFMRFRSPKNSPINSSSSNEEASKHFSCENLTKVCTEKMESKSQSMPSISNSSSQSEPKEHIIPIRVEDESDQDVPQEPVLKTPQRDEADKAKQSRTPESAVKAHKRLEWDSLADVGYQKSKSTSNISIVERMLLREFFEVTSNSPKQVNSSESDIRHLEQEIADLGTLKKHFAKPVSKDESKYSSPPLAHSTHYENSNAKKTSMHMKAKNVQTSTNTTSSLQQKFEKYAQTSLCNAEMKSKEVQVTLKPTDTSPCQVSSSVSSFEYRSRQSTNNSGCTKSSSSSNVPNQVQRGDDSQHPFVKGVKEMVQKRKALSVKNRSNKNDELSNIQPVQESEKLKSLFSDFQQLINEDKENTSTSSAATSSSNASTIDFGIQLIFNIMKAKSVDPKQKKKLVKNIVKRITKIANSRELHGIVSKTSALFTTESENGSGKGMQRELGGEFRSHLRKTTSDSVVSDIQEPNEATQTAQGSKKTATRCTRQEQKNIPTEAQRQHIKKNLQTFKEQDQKSVEQATCSRATAGKDQSKSSSINATTTTSVSSDHPGAAVKVTLSLGRDGRVVGATATELEGTTSTGSISATGTTSTSAISSTSASHDPSTQKPSKRNDVNMKDWLSPMTKSEIEFEKKKRATVQTKRPLSKTKNLECREQQLNWIECEIERLQSLRNLLLNDEQGQTTADDDLKTEKHKQEQHPSTTTQTSEKLYDTVYSDQSRKSTSLPSQKQKSALQSPVNTKKINKPSESPKKVTVSKQRSKIDTPSASPSDTNDQESVSSLVRRRKKELLNHYQPQKMHHCTCAPKACIVDGPTTSAAAAAAMAAANKFMNENCGFYAQPMFMQHNMPPTAYYTYPPMMHTQFHGYAQQQMQHAAQPTGPPAGEPAKEKSANFDSMPSASSHVPPASSSAFRGSSELTVPMGSFATSATPTTTHQYDDVAAVAAAATSKRSAVGSQTGPSLRRSKPIYETRCASPQKSRNMMPYRAFMTTCGPVGRSTICVQTQPSRATAYALQFVVREGPQNSASVSSSATSETTSSTSEELRILAAQAGPSLQDALQQRRPEFLKQAKNRKSVINRIQKMRQERERELRKIADGNLSVTSLDKKLNNLPPPATERLRLFSTKQMKELSKKHLANLPEVVAGQDRQRDERNKRSNRLLRDVYNRRLQKRVRNGKLDFQHSRTLI